MADANGTAANTAQPNQPQLTDDERAAQALVEAKEFYRRYEQKIAELNDIQKNQRQRKTRDPWTAGASGVTKKLKRPSLTANFIEKPFENKADAQHVELRMIGDMSTCMFIVSGDSNPSLAFKVACLGLLETNDFHQSTTYICSLIVMVVPHLKTMIMQALNRAGIEPVPTEPEVLLNLLDVDASRLPFMPPAYCSIIWAVCLLLLFKNANTKNYPQFIANRVRALSRACHAPVYEEEERRVRIPITLAQATNLYSMVGSQKEFAQGLFIFLMSHIDFVSHVQKAISYVQEMLSWTELNIYKFVDDMILKTNSPVIRERVMKAEVDRFSRALSIIASCPYPQYSRVFVSEHEQRYLRRQNFPMLIQLGLHLKRVTNGEQVQQFVDVKGIDMDLFHKLLAQHLQAISLTEAKPDDRSIRYLFRDEEDSDDDYF